MYPATMNTNDWRQLTPAEEAVIVRKGTERPGTGSYEKSKEPGTYVCKRCGAALYRAEDKFDAGCGWPSFFDPAKPHNVKEIPDTSYGMTRMEVVCAKCGGHLGHVFDDGPEPTGKRYCINSAALIFKKK